MKMKVFKSLNCYVCKSPFAPIANQPKSPRYLGCGRAACHECFETEKVLKKEERRHKCTRENCFVNPGFAYSLIDILSSDSLAQDPNRSGYLLSKDFVMPECPICHEEFSTVGEKTPYRLSCLHNLCKGCFDECRKTNEADSKKHYLYIIRCAKCNRATLAPEGTIIDYLTLDFFQELPEMTRQLEEMKNSEFRFCDDCKRLDSIEKMFACSPGSKQICGTCAFQGHRGRNRKVSPLLDKEALDLSNTIKEELETDFTDYKDIVPELHSELGNRVEAFEKKLASKVGTLMNKRSFGTLERSHNHCKRLKSAFETISKEYLPNLRKYNTDVEALIQELEEEPD